jgi:hypothetical protein
LHKERVQDITELIRFAYDQGHGELKGLVAHYAASQVKKLGKTECFVALLQEGGAFSRDFWILVLENML